MGKKMETTTVCWGYTGIIEKKMENSLNSLRRSYIGDCIGFRV